MLGLKKRWLTVRSSTNTRALPTRPSAPPKPVMLRIIGRELSYVLTTALSIPELPAHAVDTRRPRHLEPGNGLIALAEDVAELPGEHGVHDSDLEKRRHHAALGRGERGAVGQRKDRGATVLVRAGREQTEIPARKAAPPLG